jgi:DNA modification methylase
MKIADIKLNDQNPRYITDVKFKQLVASIADFPKMMRLRPITLNNRTEKLVLGGNMRLRACMELAMVEIPDDWLQYAEDLTAEEQQRFIIEDNVAFGEWDWDVLANQWDAANLLAWGLDFPAPEAPPDPTKLSKRLMRDVFIVPPFSILDTTMAEWQDRKAIWMGIIGDATPTKENVLYKTDANGGDNMFAAMESSSNFDPVLAEVLCKWFGVRGGKVLDPFAGEQVKGIVCGEIGMKYTGVEIRPEQVEYNRKAAEKYGKKVKYVAGDSMLIEQLVRERNFDFVFTSPPYYDLEVYGKADLSALGTYTQFLKAYGQILAQTYKMLADDRFMALKVGEIRDKTTGEYRNFVADTIAIMVRMGAKYYNEIILVNSIGSLPLRAGHIMNISRKVGKRHQNVLVFYKGELAAIKDNFKEIVPVDEENKEQNSGV